jgi:hypothetical protein
MLAITIRASIVSARSDHRHADEASITRPLSRLPERAVRTLSGELRDDEAVEGVASDGVVAFRSGRRATRHLRGSAR